MRKFDWEKNLFFSNLKSNLKKLDWYKTIGLLIKLLSLYLVWKYRVK
ncbi:hypothetical protein LGL55_05965 [Clostridium tagluense]|nr:hypothetical protein [Clostridium tagluense]MCB2310668.1 hypothetical protein [Clostridium tagluense]MCB2334971.1 hypothetical protein [Clostridium tagluense]MCB2363763.1 hypothetical protein [Clostridium tagluense]